MKSAKLFFVFGCTCAVNALAAVSWTEYFGGTAPASGTVTITAGSEVVIGDEEMSTSSGCTVNMEEGSTLKLDTSTAPKFALGTKCYGTVEKVSSADWPVATKNQSNFGGKYIIASGSVQIDGTYFKIFGNVETPKSSLAIRSRAKLIYSGGSASLGSLPILLAGTIELNKSTFNSSVFRFVTLEGDSSIVLSGNATAFVDSQSLEKPAFINLGGYTLGFGGEGNLQLKNGSIKGAGNIVLNAGTSSKPFALQLDNFDIGRGDNGDYISFGDWTALATTKPINLSREVRIASANVSFPGPGWTIFSGGITGSEEAIGVFKTNSVASGMVAFENVNIVNDTLDKSVYESIDDGAIWVGHSATGGLGIANGCVVKSKLVIGGINDAKKYQNGSGIVRQTDGELHIIGSAGDSAMRNASTIGWSAQGTYELLDGTSRALGSFVIGMASPGILMQKGGIFEQVAHPLGTLEPSVYLPLNVNDTDATGIGAVVCVAGGTMKLSRIMLSHGRESQGIITVSGAGSRLETPARIYSGFQEGTFACVNINDGGVLATPYFAYSTNVDSPFYVNFNGGTLEVMPFVKGESELSTLFGLPNGAVPQITRVTIGEQGAAIDTKGRDMFCDVPLSSAEGMIVSAIPFVPEAGWTVAPFVKIVDNGGDGVGATAVADFDSENGILKGFIVTSGGWNYTDAKAQVIVGKTCLKELDCTLASAPAAGSFEKKGEGKLTLSRPNAWSGKTIVSGGELIAACEGAIPDGTALRLEGGVLDLGAYETSFSSIGGSGGKLIGGSSHYTVQNLDATTGKALELGGAKLVVTGGLTLDGEAVVDGEYPVYGDADIEFAPGSTITIKNPQKLANAEKMYVLLRARSIKGAPVLSNADELAPLEYSVRSGWIKLGRPSGMSLIVR